MSAMTRGVRQVRGLGTRLVHHRRHGGYKDLSALPVCGAGVRPLASQRARRTP